MKDSTRRRWRGALWLAVLGDPKAPNAAYVCMDPFYACLRLAGWPDGMLWRFPPSERQCALRRFLAGGDAPGPGPWGREREPLLAGVMAAAGVSRGVAREAVREVVAELGGAGAVFLPEIEALPKSGDLTPFWWIGLADREDAMS